MIGFVCGHCNGRQSHRNYQARRGDAAFLYEYLCIIIPVFCSLSFIDVYNYRVICQWERQSIFSPADSWLLRGNIGFTAWPSMATAIAMAIVDYDGRLHPASSLLSRLPRKVRTQRNGPGDWRDTATEPPRHGRGHKVTPSRPGAPRNSGKVRTSIFHCFQFGS